MKYSNEQEALGLKPFPNKLVPNINDREKCHQVTENLWGPHRAFSARDEQRWVVIAYFSLATLVFLSGLPFML